MTAEYGAFTQSIIQSGHFKAGDGLQPSTTATTVRVPRRQDPDNPTVRSRRRGVASALPFGSSWRSRRRPASPRAFLGAKTGSIEVRPIMIYD